MKKRNSKKKGFTLIELIVVIAILGILATIAVPRLAGFQESAKKKTIEANLRTIDSAIAAYEAQKGALPADIPALVSSRLLNSNPSTTGVTYGIIGGNAVVTIAADADVSYTTASGITLTNLKAVSGW